MEDLKLCLQSFQEMHHYIQSLLADPNYDPHFSTIGHLTELDTICKKVLTADFAISSVNEWLPEFIAKKKTTITICCDSFQYVKDGPVGCGIVINSLDTKPYTMSRVSPNATSEHEGMLDAIYEGLNALKFAGHHGLSILIKIPIQYTISNLNRKTDHTRREKSVLLALQETKTHLGIPITLEYHSRTSSSNSKQAGILAIDTVLNLDK